ncbi:MAG: hypothetical protein IPO83_14535 [Chitinophagaceae bacterium]|nr:hypothetical protein [Chitinophagaceae bacterium]
MDYLLIGSMLGRNISAHDTTTFAYITPFLVGSPSPPNASKAGYSCPVLGHNGRLYVKLNNEISATQIESYDRKTGNFISTCVKASGMGACNFLINNEGELLAFDLNGNINRHHADSGSLIDVYVKNTYLKETLEKYDSAYPLTMRLQSDQYILISVIYNGIGADAQALLRFDQRTGKFLDVLIPKTDLNYHLSLDFIVGPGHHIFATNFNTGQVLRYDRSSGSFLSVFASHPSLIHPHGLIFGPDGNLYVTDPSQNVVFRFNHSGVFLGSFTTPPAFAGPTYMVFVNNPPSVIPIF